ncbi:sugar transferase [Bifidobacterium sp. 64T4]|uniref:sugar transferase n=1 Tax=Bifidobacterium pongonis TaxID=2834432 RepID=UPI001C55A2C6|nr:sugar transferase [Bifidobacterium pongonis]MBW3095531.1 sugar transferase [Bifidobacterium pongonis]
MTQNNNMKMRETSQHRVTSVAYWRFFVNIALTACDMASFILASVAVLVLRGEVDLHSSRFHFDIALPWYVLVCAVIWVLCMNAVGVYHRHVMGDGYQLNLLLFKGAVFAGIMICAMDFILNAYLSLMSTALCLICALLLTMIVRFVVRRVVLFSREKGEYSYATVVVGSAEGIEHALQILSQKRQLNYRPVAVCPIALDPSNGHVKGIASSEEFKRSVREICGKDIPVLVYGPKFAEHAVAMGVQTVMVTDVMQRFSDNFNTFVLDVESMNLEIAVVTSAVDAGGHETQIRVIQGTTVMTICLPQYSPAAMLQKRIFDIVVSALAIVVSSPIMLAVALAIKLEDHGPALYTQERIGLRGKPFKIHKFRSMYVNADEKLAEVAAANGLEIGACVKIKNDPRITKVGRFIRKTSLDELPQFFDSFIGTMSVVGPRPQRQFEVDGYDQVYATRLLVKPGITGPWQVSGRNDLSDEESHQLDVGYVQSWSVLGDCVILLRTVGAVLSHNGAY